MTPPNPEADAASARPVRQAWRPGMPVLLAGVAGVVLLAVMSAGAGRAWAPSYLFAWLSVLGISLGSMVLTVVHSITRGDWGEEIRPACEAVLRIFPAVLLLALPLLFRLDELFPWMRTADAGAADVPGGMQWYLNVPFFLLRAVIYFAVWLALAWFLAGARVAVAPAQEQRRAARLRMVSSLGFVVLAFTITFAAIDWMVSLAPPWRSTVFGLLIGVGQVMAALAVAIIAAAVHAPGGREDSAQRSGAFHDLGNLMFALVLLWAYLALMQYLIIWIEDLPDETAWYLVRTRTSWGAWIPALVGAHFLVPFLALLSRQVKRNPATLAAVAALVLFGCLVDAFWTVEPAFRTQGMDLGWNDLFAPLAVWGLWTGLLQWALQPRGRAPGGAHQAGKEPRETPIAEHP